MYNIFHYKEKQDKIDKQIIEEANTVPTKEAALKAKKLLDVRRVHERRDDSESM